MARIDMRRFLSAAGIPMPNMEFRGRASNKAAPRYTALPDHQVDDMVKSGLIYLSQAPDTYELTDEGWKIFGKAMLEAQSKLDTPPSPPDGKHRTR